MRLMNKFYIFSAAVQFANGFIKKQNEMAREHSYAAMTEEQQNFVITSIVNCDTAQTLLKLGKSMSDICVILDSKNMNKEKFEALTNKAWPI